MNGLLTTTVGFELEGTNVTRKKVAEVVNSVIRGTINEKISKEQEPESVKMALDNMGVIRDANYYEYKEHMDVDVYDIVGEKTWKVVEDFSIYPSYGMDRCFEVVTPVISEEKDLSKLWKIMRRLNKVKALTNDSCGMHMHIGIDDPNHVKKFIMGIYENQDYLIKKFTRNENRLERFAKPFEGKEIDELKNKDVRCFEDILTVFTTKEDMYDYSNKDTKHRILGLNSLVAGHVEYRASDGTVEETVAKSLFEDITYIYEETKNNSNSTIVFPTYEEVVVYGK
ncbi:MAG: amidoligase family protein [Clostridia bacterium]|jgi:hypothetical protein|nr:amidoligase family protein [Clostridia bacterium]